MKQNFLARVANAIDQLTAPNSKSEVNVTAPISPAPSGMRGSFRGLPECGKLPVERARKPDQPPAPRKVSFEEQCRFVAADFPKPSKSEMQALKSLQERCDRTWDDICKTFNRDAAQRDFAGFDREQWNKIYESGNDLSDCTVVTREDFFHDYEDKQQAAKRLHEKLRESGRDLCKPIITQFADAAKAALHRLETAERSEAGALGFEFVPSPRVQVLRQLLVRLNNFQKSPHAGTPRQLLSWLEI
jgi:hypothetical protein